MLFVAEQTEVRGNTKPSRSILGLDKEVPVKILGLLGESANNNALQKKKKKKVSPSCVSERFKSH